MAMFDKVYARITEAIISRLEQGVGRNDSVGPAEAHENATRDA